MAENPSPNVQYIASKKMIWRALLALLLLGVAFCGCRGHPGGEDPNVKMINWLVGEDPCMVEVRQQRLRAIQMSQNGVLDTEPVLLEALLSHVEGRPFTNSHFFVYHEDQPVMGFEITEVNHVSSPPAVRIEEYPAFLYSVSQKTVQDFAVPVQIRRNGETKDDEKWGQFARGEGLDEQEIRKREYLRTSPFTIWVSIPEPNIMDVSIRVYDRAGHKSDSMPLVMTRAMKAWRKAQIGTDPI